MAMAKVRILRFVFLCAPALLVFLFGFLFFVIAVKVFLSPVTAVASGFSFAITRRSIIIAGVLLVTAIASLIFSLVRAFHRRHPSS
jgi:hypothetical protein